MAPLGLILLGVAAMVLGLALGLVATPLHIALSVEAGGETRGRLRLRPFWGLSPALRLPVDARQLGRIPTGSAKLRDLSLPRLSSLRVLFARIQVDRLDLDLRFGTGDPAETGALYGYVTALAHALPHCAGLVRLHPDFAAAGLAGKLEARLHVIPLALVAPAIRIARDMAGRRA
jgi:hypothetical protein